MSCVKQSGEAASGLPGPDPSFNAFAAMEPRAPLQTPVEARNGRRVKDAAVPPQGVYLPNDNVLTPQMRSPGYVQMSNAAAITLGIMPGKMHRCGCTRCLNLLLTYPEGCRANCAYCGLARHREAERDYADRNFIRVDWPAVPLDMTIDIVARDGVKSPTASSPFAVQNAMSGCSPGRICSRNSHASVSAGARPSLYQANSRIWKCSS